MPHIPIDRELHWEMPFAAAPATAQDYQRLFSDERRMQINLCVDLSSTELGSIYLRHKI